MSTDLLSKSIAVVTEGQSLLEKIKELGENAPKEETQVTLAACGGIQKAVEELMQRRKMLEDLLSQKRKRLNQFATVGELDQELNKVRCSPSCAGMIVRGWEGRSRVEAELLRAETIMSLILLVFFLHVYENENMIFFIPYFPGPFTFSRAP